MFRTLLSELLLGLLDATVDILRIGVRTTRMADGGDDFS